MDAAVVAGIAAAASAVVVGAATVIQAQVSQRRQLRHDRETRELQVLRDALDEALTSARKRYATTRDLRSRRSFGEAALKDLAETEYLVPAARAKLEVRLGRTHPVAESYNVVRGQLNALVKLIHPPLGEGESPDSREDACHEQAERVRRALEDFTDQAARLAELDSAIRSRADAAPVAALRAGSREPGISKGN
jgi:hypothetical protein